MPNKRVCPVCAAEYEAAVSGQPMNCGECLMRDVKMVRLVEARHNIPLGRVVATPGAAGAIQKSKERMSTFITRHMLGDWGDISQGDRELNEESTGDGDRTLSSHKTELGVRLWVISEGYGQDRVTTILLPEEY